MNDAIEQRLRAALLTGDQAALADWASTGIPGLRLLRECLTGAWHPGPSGGTHERDLIDNTCAAVAAIAAAEPRGFLDVFDDPRLVDNGFVLIGLGRIDDPRATELLVQAARSEDHWRRMDAAMGLGRRSAPSAIEALLGLITDPDDLVRYHALRSLARIGDASVLPVLRGHVPASGRQAELLEEAIASIVARTAEGDPNR